MKKFQAGTWSVSAEARCLGAFLAKSNYYAGEGVEGVEGAEAARRPPPDTSINIHALIPCIVNGHFYRAENNGAATRITHHNHAGAGRTNYFTPRPSMPPNLNLQPGQQKSEIDVRGSVGLRPHRRAIELIGACYLNF
ncbi:hypothetical protein E2C01_014577 [Portunus trituberculatus]|uniref:Uncharacterized protein n=1 Tax=Portunus trituberculatus TaxID=210409 RepID=A0A5B7DJK2_PORTR|nr:hypothetical protein [Portunus trituberculatus]